MHLGLSQKASLGQGGWVSGGGKNRRFFLSVVSGFFGGGVAVVCLFVCFETGFLCIALAVLELTL